MEIVTLLIDMKKIIFSFVAFIGLILLNGCETAVVSTGIVYDCPVYVGPSMMFYGPYPYYHHYYYGPPWHYVHPPIIHPPAPHMGPPPHSVRPPGPMPPRGDVRPPLNHPEAALRPLRRAEVPIKDKA